MHPIRQQHDVRRQIEVVEMGIWVARRRLAHDNRAMYAVEFLQASVSVPEVSSRITGPLVSARWKRDQKLFCPNLEIT